MENGFDPTETCRYIRSFTAAARRVLGDLAEKGVSVEIGTVTGRMKMILGIGNQNPNREVCLTGRVVEEVYRLGQNPRHMISSESEVRGQLKGAIAFRTAPVDDPKSMIIGIGGVLADDNDANLEIGLRALLHMHEISDEEVIRLCERYGGDINPLTD